MQTFDRQRVTGGGAERFTLIGKRSVLQRFLLKFREENASKRQTIKLEQLHMYHQHLSIMVSMDLLETIAA